MLARLAVSVALAVVVLVLAMRYRTARARMSETDAPGGVPAVPRALLDGADRTWVLFTTPFCATCGPVEEKLRTVDPAARVVKVDATRDVALADAFGVKAAPTVLLADRVGTVHARLVGAAAVGRYVAERVGS